MNASEDMSRSIWTIPEGVQYILTSIQCLIVTGTLLGNAGTIVAFYKVRSLREKPSDLFILSLSCADLIMGCVITFTVPTYALGYWVWGKTLCQLFATLANIAVIAGILNTLMICWDRYLLISKEYPKYVKMQSKHRVIGIITVVWAYSVVSGFIEWIVWDIVNIPETVYEFDFTRECRSPPKHDFIYQTQAFTLNGFLPLLGIEGLSVAFVVLLRRKLHKRMQVTDFEYSNTQSQQLQERGDQPGGSLTVSRSNVVHTSNNTLSGSTSGHRNIGVDSTNMLVNTRNAEHTSSNPKNRYVKAAITLAALVIALNLCLLPFILYTLYVSLVCPICSDRLIRDILSNIVVPLNSCLNPILYAATMSKIKRFYKRLFGLTG
ncbi:histamine H3 receptor-like [Amphiura filiformis]|uniref:histamine H3 receptor-like n=1 Tax=Amphiura filiformis TaxID=82378 RepID=UPI003B21EE63